MFENKEIEDRVILIAVSLGSVETEETESLLDELSELVSTAGGITVGRLIQNKADFDHTTYLGKGKVEELRDLIYETEATLVVCDDELSPIQQKNLENALDIAVLDRTAVILDIFAKHAVTSEGKLQVELAQLRYRATRLVGSRSELSRLGGGIGTRGPGEKKLETDRRIIKNRIAQLSHECKEIEAHRDVTRKQRMQASIPIVSIVGYTNAGKSTLLNKLTEAGVLEENKLFATLDPTSRTLLLPQGKKVIMTDTVGFIRKLPHHLIKAFKSTLEESQYADIILHVVDCTNPDCDKHIRTVYETLDTLGVKDKTIITVFNKVDMLSEAPAIRDFRAEKNFFISAKKGTCLTELLTAIEDIINDNMELIEKLIPYQNAGVISKIRDKGTLLSEEYREDGIFVKAYIPKELNI